MPFWEARLIRVIYRKIFDMSQLIDVFEPFSLILDRLLLLIVVVMQWAGSWVSDEPGGDYIYTSY